ncbi:hypothetical protein [Aeoliella sp. SH292]|jgi:hypothetical protein|uniref:hypothetical protein n=1 Tax=Aeoliella sp. SH292 TaxID=3454464 RepID=UPI003F9ADBA2
MNLTVEMDDDLDLAEAPRFQKWNRPDRCSARESVRKGLCRSKRTNGSPSFSRSASFKKQASRKFA